MKTITAAVAAVVVCAAPAFAQTTGAQQKLSSAECQQVWNKANPGGEPSVSQTKVEQWVTDVKKVDSNGDGMITSTEFTSACGQGYVRSAAAGGAGGATGAGAGTSGQGAGQSPGMKPSR